LGLSPHRKKQVSRRHSEKGRENDSSQGTVWFFATAARASIAGTSDKRGGKKKKDRAQHGAPKQRKQHVFIGCVQLLDSHQLWDGWSCGDSHFLHGDKTNNKYMLFGCVITSKA
jgi:hypothetical protein